MYKVILIRWKEEFKLDYKMIIGEKIWEIRKNKKLTQKQFGNLLGTNQQAIVRWEKGKSLPNIKTLKKIEELNGSPVAEISDYLKVGEKIKHIRLERSMTLEQFGRLFNTHKQVVSLWENGKHLPKSNKLKKIANSVGMSVIELLNTNLPDTNPLEEYSTNELIEELKKKSIKKRRLIKAVIQILTKVIITRWKGIFNESVIN